MFEEIKEKLAQWKIPIWQVLLLGLVVILAFKFFNPNESEKENEQLLDQLVEEEWADPADSSQPSMDASSLQVQSEENHQAHEIVVEIKGAVENPGVYEMTSKERVDDLVKKAGGLSEHALATEINMAKALQDEMVVYIPMKGEDIPEAYKMDVSNTIQSSAETDSQSAGRMGKVNLNTADLQELMTLNGIGEKKAQAIIDYRENEGPFQTIEDIKNVSGIGDKSFEKLKEDLSV